MIIWQL